MEQLGLVKCLSVSYPQRWWKFILQKKKKKNQAAVRWIFWRGRRGWRQRHPGESIRRTAHTKIIQKPLKLKMQCCEKVFWFQSFRWTPTFTTHLLYMRLTCCWENSTAGKKKLMSKIALNCVSWNTLPMKKSAKGEVCVSKCSKLKGKQK